jgi:beta-N-acetylhexosaminidase
MRDEMAERRIRRRDRRRRAVYLRRRAVAVGVLVALVAIIAKVVGDVADGGGTTASRPATRAVTGPRRVNHLAGTPVPGGNVSRLSPAQLAGQRVIYAYSGLKPPASLLDAIRAGEAGGVILFGPNVAGANQLRAVVGELQRASAESPVPAPLLVLTDQEGGEVRRLPGAPALSEREIGQSPNRVALASQAGAAAAQTLSGSGVNVNLSPVLDVARRPGNFIDQFQRSYGDTPDAAAQLGRAFIVGQQRLGVLATAKHFPGLGAATRGENTDSRPVTLNLSLPELRNTDELPYRSAIAAGVKLVMSSWAVYPELDPDLPAGLSARVIQGELRDRLGYSGVTITDTLSAAALSRFGTLAQRGVLAAKAGADLIICSGIDGNDDPSGGLSVLSAIASAIARGELSKAAAQQAAARVLALRLSLRRAQ